MQFMIGTKREITIKLHKEELEKHVKRLNDSMECFRRFEDSSDLEHLIEDCEKLLEAAKNAKTAIEFMDYAGIK